MQLLGRKKYHPVHYQHKTNSTYTTAGDEIVFKGLGA